MTENRNLDDDADHGTADENSADLNATDSTTDDSTADDRDAGGRRLPGVGDDERANREHIAETGEPQRDALGNADGAS